MTTPPILPQRFTARIVPGAGRGKTLGTPTLNLDLRDIPATLPHGIYACRVSIPQQTMTDIAAAVHFGPRPVFRDSVAFEVHLLETTLTDTPAMMDVEMVAFLREVRDFPDVDALKSQIAEDMRRTKEVLRSI